MGRGRAKAKQTKVARQLKYSSPAMDIEALQREIGSGTSKSDREVDHDKYADPYAAYDEDDEDDEDDRRR